MSYYRTPYDPRVSLGGRITPGVKGLIIANVAVFILQVLSNLIGREPLEIDFGLQYGRLVGSLALWQLVTYMFLHAPHWLWHLLLNMLMLWMFGTEVERVWGTRAFVRYYFVCGIGAGIVTALAFRESNTIGASGAVFGVMLAYAMMFPRRQILVWMLFPMQARSFVLLCIGIELFSLLGLPDGVAHTAHLGGMLFGYLYMKRAWRVQVLWRDLRLRLRRRRFRVMRGDDEHYPYH